VTWQPIEHRLLLLELLARGRAPRRRAQEAAFATLAELPWTRRTGRRDELALVAERRPELVALIARSWPEWSAALAELLARGLPPTPAGWARLETARRGERLPALPDRLNRHTAAALAGAHSKAGLAAIVLATLGDTATTHDGAVRMRPPRGLSARTAHGTLDLGAIAQVLGEVAIPERALRDGLTLAGPIRAVLSVENLGAFCDLPDLDGWLSVHVPGWDTPTVALLLAQLRDVPVVHFGDLDPNGVRILQHLRTGRPDVRWFVPEFWQEAVARHGLPGAWPAELDLRAAPAFVQELAARGLWLEQEVIVLDARLPAALAAMVWPRSVR
jgi:hypothetical protein